MPKDEFDFEDPLELNGVAFLTEQDTSAEMAECFAEEFMRMGYNHKQVLALFRNPHYVGPNMVLANKGEPFVRDIIAETFARWGKKIEWPADTPLVVERPAENFSKQVERRFPNRHEPEHSASHADLEIGAPAISHSCTCSSGGCSPAPTGQSIALDDQLTDPLGNPAPKLNL